MDQQPHTFDAMRAQLLANCSELLVRQLERRWALEMAERQDGRRLMRSLTCYETAYLFVDVAGPTWRVLHANQPAIDLLGAPRAGGVLYERGREVQGPMRQCALCCSGASYRSGTLAAPS